MLATHTTMSAIGFFVKKSVSAALYPLGLAVFLLIVGTFLCNRRPASRRGFLVAAVGLLWLLLMSFPITGFFLLRSLETKAGDYASPSMLAASGVKYVVVLGATVVTDELSSADRWSGEGILRLMEGVRLWEGVSGSKLVLSGGSFPGRQSKSDAMATLPAQLGVPRESLVLETQAADTIDEATLFMTMLGKEKPFALVTSALHMPRSMEIFRSQGMKPIACPCAFRTKMWPIWYSWFVPDVNGLQNSHLAVHEYLGRLWLRFRKVLTRFCPANS